MNFSYPPKGLEFSFSVIILHVLINVRLELDEKKMKGFETRVDLEW